jgi:predicted 2-oxoglutarate/Fe(II)-dependent dioxygenase YbiX
MSHSPLYWHWNNVLDLKTIKEMNKFIISNYNFLEGNEKKANNLNNNLKKNTETYIITYKKIKPYISKLIKEAFMANRENFGYDLFDMEDSSGCNYNVYKTSNKANYDWHIDGSTSPYSDIKLTLIINLSEKKFDGGNLYLQEGVEQEVKQLKEIGSMIMFKSFVRHSVTPILSGERKNLTIFLDGPNFK